jgi:WD40 repeat protein
VKRLRGVSYMQMVEILIEENAFGAVRALEVAAQAPVAELIPALIAELKLPQTDLFGNRLVYMLRYASGGPVLPDDKSLTTCGVAPGAKLALDSYVIEGSVAAVMGERSVYSPPGFHSSTTLADTDSFKLPGKDTSGSFPAVKRKKRRWTRRAFLVLGGATLAAGTAGIGYAAYKSLQVKSPALKQLTRPQTNPTATPKPTLPTAANSLLVFTQHQQTVRSVRWSPDGLMIASGANDSQVFVWGLDGAVHLQSKQAGPVRAIAWSPDGQQLVAGALNQLLFLNPTTGAVLAHSTHTHTAAVTTLAWSFQNPLHMVSGALDKKAVVWNTASHRPQLTFNLHTEAIESASWASDGQTVATSSLGGVVRVWNATGGQQVHGLYQDAQVPMRALAFAPVGSLLAVGGDDGIVRMWNNGLICQQQTQGQFGAQCLDMPVRLHAHTNAVRTLAWSPDGRFLATGGDDGKLIIWYPASSQMPLLQVQVNAPVLALTWSPDGKKVATASGNVVTVWGLS